MKSNISKLSMAVIIGSLLLAACSSVTLLSGQAQTEQKAPVATVTAPQPAQPQTNTKSGADTSLSGYETALENIYAQVNPAVVSIRVVEQDTSTPNSNSNPFSNIPGLPFFGTPGQNNNQPSAPQVSQ